MNCNRLKPGDWVWTIQYGWVQVARTTNTQIVVDTHDDTNVNQIGYSKDGKYFDSDRFPSLFPQALPQVDPFSQPPILKKGDRVLVRHVYKCSWKPAYFAAYRPAHRGIYCFCKGKTEWSSKGSTEYFPEFRLPDVDCANSEVSR